MIKEYLIQEKLGIGSYGTVYKVTKKNSNDNYVIKQISLFGLTPEEIKDVELEASILSSIKSIFVVRYYDSFKEKNFLNIVMEYCDGGDLGKFIEEKKAKNEPINEDLIWILFIKITLGLGAIHKLKILHRDLKTLNIFLSKNLEVKIGDLGVAKILSHSGCFAKTIIGTPYYLSPELCEEKPYNYKSDIWALGCILYELCTFKHPFNAKSQGGLILKILEGKPEPIGNNYSNDLQNLINIIFEKKMDKRPSCYDLLKNRIIMEKAEKFGLLNMVIDLYPDLIENTNQFKINNKVSNNKLIYNKNRYPRNYKIKNSLQKNNSIGIIEIKKTNENVKNNINNIYKKNRIKCKSQFNSISTDSRSHNSIKNILYKNNENETKDIQLNNSKNKNGDNVNYINNIHNNFNNINTPFYKKPLDKFPSSALNKKIKEQNVKNVKNGRYTNFEKNNCYLIIKDNKEIKSINSSSKSDKKLFINLNNNSKSNLFKNGISLSSNKNNDKKFIIFQKPKYESKPQNILNNKINVLKNNYDNFNIRNYLNKNNSNKILIIKKEKENEKENITSNNSKEKKEIIEKSKNINESIENFEKKLKNYYQYSPKIKSKKTDYNNYNKNKNQIKNKEFISDDILLKLTPIDIIDTNNNKDIMNMVEKQYNKNTNGKNNNLMEFVKNLNEYIPQYKINNQIPNGYKRYKNKSKSVCENENVIDYNI